MPRPLSPEARQKAIDATLHIVAEQGIAGFTVDGVAKRSGVAKTTLYRHWESGNDLLVQSLDCQVQALETPNTGSLVGDLTELLATMATIGAVDGNRRLMLDLLSAAAKDPELAAVQEAMVAEHKRPILDVLKRARDRGEIATTIDDQTALLLIEGPVLARMLLARDPIGEDEIPRLVELIARALGTR